MKYIDLEEQIVDDSHAHRQSIFSNDARVVLRWLDAHPEQLAGRTITVTASEFDEAVESCITEDATVPPHKFAERLGVVCVPDPEATNLQRLSRAIRDWEQGRGADRILARHLNALGVTAPGGDE